MSANNTPTWTKAELRQFDKLTAQAESCDQVTRIKGRFALRTFVEKHGREKCDAMFKELTK